MIDIDKWKKRATEIAAYGGSDFALGAAELEELIEEVSREREETVKFLTEYVTEHTEVDPYCYDTTGKVWALYSPEFMLSELGKLTGVPDEQIKKWSNAKADELLAALEAKLN